MNFLCLLACLLAPLGLPASEPEPHSAEVLDRAAPRPVLVQISRGAAEVVREEVADDGTRATVLFGA